MQICSIFAYLKCMIISNEFLLLILVEGNWCLLFNFLVGRTKYYRGQINSGVISDLFKQIEYGISNAMDQSFVLSVQYLQFWQFKLLPTKHLKSNWRWRIETIIYFDITSIWIRACPKSKDEINWFIIFSSPLVTVSALPSTSTASLLCSDRLTTRSHLTG